MIRILSVITTAFVLVGCGADGSPERPSEPGISISGETTVGVVVQ